MKHSKRASLEGIGLQFFAMGNLDAIQQKRTDILQRMTEAVQANDREKFTQAFSDLADAVGESILGDVRALRDAQDENILAARGCRVLTSQERQYYEAVIGAMKSDDPKQALTNINKVLPETVIDAVFEDIFPDAVKTGMVASVPLIEVIADKLEQYRAKHIVVDPVMVATSGDRLISEDAVEALKARLLPMAAVITPNIPEAELLSGRKIQSVQDMEDAARAIYDSYGCAVLCKGGHNLNDANDLLWQGGGGQWFRGRRIDNPNTHGTGCTLSSAIASNLAKGYGLAEAVERAKTYLSGALGAMLDLGRGPGPMNHAFDIKPAYRKTAD